MEAFVSFFLGRPEIFIKQTIISARVRSRAFKSTSCVSTRILNRARSLRTSSQRAVLLRHYFFVCVSSFDLLKKLADD
jgi:hypothetical protein